MTINNKTKYGNLITLVVCVLLTGSITFYIVRNVYDDKIRHLEMVQDDLICENQLLSEKIRLIDENFNPIRKSRSNVIPVDTDKKRLKFVSRENNEEIEVSKNIEEISKILDTVKLTKSLRTSEELIKSLKNKIKE